MSIKSKIQSLITAANAVTGESDTTLTDAVQTLVDGYGQGGGGENGLVDLIFNYTDSNNQTISGSISNNYVQNFSSPAYYQPPFLLKNLITINTGDVVTLTFSNISVAAGGSALNYADCGLVTPTFNESRAGSQIIAKTSNFLFPRSGRIEKTVTHSGSPQLISGVALWPRTSTASGVSYEIHLTINGTSIF